MSEDNNDGRIEINILGLVIAGVIALIVAAFVFDIPISSGPIIQIFQ